MLHGQWHLYRAQDCQVEMLYAVWRLETWCQRRWHLPPSQWVVIKLCCIACGSCYRCRTGRSVCLSVCLLDTTVSSTKTDEPIKVPFGVWTRVDHPRNHVLDGGAPAMRPFVIILVLLSLFFLSSDQLRAASLIGWNAVTWLCAFSTVRHVDIMSRA